MPEPHAKTSAGGGDRSKIVATVAVQIAALPGDIVLVAVDGISGAGKSHFAGELAHALRAAGRPVIRASVNDFHRPKIDRYRMGRSSPDGHYLESYDYGAFKRELLDPLRVRGARLYRTAVFDCALDRAIDSPQSFAPDGAIAVVDGLFLNRDELREYWDVSIFLDVPFDIAIRRCAQRDGTPSPDVADPANRRYVLGETRYLQECGPRDRASIVIDNSDFSRPVRLR